MSKSIEIIKRISKEYQNSYNIEPKKGHYLHDLATKDLVSVLKDKLELDEKKYKIKGSIGIGRWAEIPWIGIFDKSITTSAKKGIYVVLLFKKEEEELYLSLGQV